MMDVILKCLSVDHYKEEHKENDKTAQIQHMVNCSHVTCLDVYVSKTTLNMEYDSKNCTLIMKKKKTWLKLADAANPSHHSKRPRLDIF